MKRTFFVFLLLLMMLNGNTLAEGVQYSASVESVRSAYNRAVATKGDSDAAYNEIYNVIRELRSAILMNDKEEVGYAQVKLFGWEDESSHSELMEKSEALLAFIVEPKGDKLSALMNKFVTMSSVDGVIEPTEVEIKVKDIDKFVKELGLCKKATGYVLAMLDVYFFSGDAVQFTKNGFEFRWKAVGPYKMNLHKVSKQTVSQVKNERFLKQGSTGDDVFRLKKRMQELGYFSSGAALSDQYNATTTERVKQFQKANGLSQTGTVDEETLKILYSDAAKENPNK